MMKTLITLSAAAGLAVLVGGGCLLGDTSEDEPIGAPADPNQANGQSETPADPAYPADPNDPADPTDPNDPADPTDPNDPANPTDPGDPNDPATPTDPTDPGDPNAPTDVDGDGYDSDVDCDDTDPSSNPAAPEDPSNGIDDDCDGVIDEGSDPTDPTDPNDPSDPTDPNDADGDGYPAGLDCDDSDPSSNPAAPEDPTNGIDDDCDGVIDEGGDPTDPNDACTADSDCAANELCLNGVCAPGSDPADPVDADGDGWAAGLDCDDSNASTNPGAPEDPNNGLDDDCDGVIDEGGSDPSQQACTSDADCGSGVCINGICEG